MIKVQNRDRDIYNLELKYDGEDLSEVELMEIFNLGMYVRRNIIKNSVIKIGGDKDSYLYKENEQLNRLLENKNREILEVNNSINERIKQQLMYLERELSELKTVNKSKDNVINNLNERVLNIREQIKSEYNIDELIRVNKELTNKSINRIGRIGEMKLYDYLMNAELLKNYYKLETNRISHSGDFCIYDEVNNYGVLVENKNYQYLVPREEVNKFRNDCSRNLLAKPGTSSGTGNGSKINIIGGVFLSYKSGISEKRSPLDINIENNKILIYISEYNKYSNLIEGSILYIFNLYNVIRDILDKNNFKCIKDKIKDILSRYTYLYNQLLNDVVNMRKIVDDMEGNLRSLNNNIINEIRLLVIDNSKKEEVNNLEVYIFNEVYNYLTKRGIKIINVKVLIEEKVFKENVKTAQGISNILGKYKEYEMNNIKIIYNNLGTRRVINSKECKNYFIIE